MPLEGTHLTQHMSSCHGKVEGELGGQILVGKTSNAIGAKSRAAIRVGPFGK